MRIVVALGGNALLERGEPPDCDIEEHHVTKCRTATTDAGARSRMTCYHPYRQQAARTSRTEPRPPKPGLAGDEKRLMWCRDNLSLMGTDICPVRFRRREVGLRRITRRGRGE
jgi:hypothetical protein